MEVAQRRERRRHSAELRARVLQACAVPGASVAGVALEHGLNANLVHRWRRLAEGRETRSRVPVREFVALPMATVPTAMTSSATIRIELRRPTLQISVEWPVSAAEHSAAWLRELLR
jgi:transposase